MKYDHYHNCLRLTVINDGMQDERIDALVAHCKKYGFDNVMLMLNQEEFNLGHITQEDAVPWVAVLKKAKQKLEESGITVSVNNWMELGHADRGRSFALNQNFRPMTDMYGREATLQVCPLCENWRSYFEEYVKYLVRELTPDTFWIEDDFRLHNHAPLEGIGCFCEEHMAYYNKRLNTDYTREEFVKKVFEPGPCNPARKAWLDANRDVMISLAERIAKAVKSVNPETDIAIMSSAPEMHCLEARDWNKLFEVLGQGGRRINRIHLCYGEKSGKEMLYYFNSVSMAVRAMADDSVLVMPETENGSASLYSRSSRFFRFSLESAIPLVLSGMTYSIYDFVGNGVRESFGYAREVSALQPYMQAIKDLNLKFSSLTGVVVPIDPRACYCKTIEKEYSELMPSEYHIAAYLSGLGVSYRYSREKEFKGKTVFMCGSSMDYFTDEELRRVFAENYVLADGSGVLRLKERGLLSLINAKGARLVKADSGYHTYEECKDKQISVCEVRGLRATCRASAGDFAEVDYKDGVCVHTEVYNQNMKRLAPAFVQGKGFSVIPYCITDKLYAHFCDLRRHFVLKAISENTLEYAICNTEGVSPYLYKQENGYVLILLNGNVDSYSEISMRLGNMHFKQVCILNKQGKTEPVSCEQKEDCIIVKAPMEYLSSTVLLFE